MFSSITVETLRPTICIGCGKPLAITTHHGRVRQTCGPICRNRVWRSNNREHSRALNKSSYEHRQSWVTYQHVNTLGEIIYIGKTNLISARDFKHKHESKWYSEIATTMVQPWKNEAAASVAEAWLIAVHKPVYNIIGLRD